MRYLIVLLLAGCATVSDVTPYGGGSYIVSGSSADGTTGSEELKVMAVQKANAYCKDLGKSIAVKEAKTSGNRWTGTGASLVFSCE